MLVLLLAGTPDSGSGAPERRAQACLLCREPHNPCAGLAEPQSTTYKQQGQENRTPNSVVVGVNPLGYRVQSHAFTEGMKPPDEGRGGSPSREGAVRSCPRSRGGTEARRGL